ncbi:DUF2130 domain-containing protein [Mesoplasma seiffertii]|uniref:DUF2130 domain-containing protein n=1 Tax=Mesoplasma seiffertii TaxID=28224 RepID=UPI00047B5AFD|nr:DUF2130 domain-containing protein [Mesoplasma seiffertii]
MSDIILICPHCNQSITKANLETSEHSWANVEKFLDQEKAAMLKTIENQVRQSLTIDFEKAKQLEVLETRKELEQEILNYKNQIEKNRAEFNNAVISAKQDYDLKLANLLNQKQTEINEIKAKLTQVQDQQELMIQNEVAAKQKQYAETINKLKNQLFEMEQAQQNLLLKKRAEYQEEIKPTIEALREQIMKKEIDLSNMKAQFEVKLATLQAETERKYHQQIEELKIANAQNKILQSKRKGENFEHEVEGELRKAFGLFDTITKINNVTADKKADYLQVIKNGQGVEIGKIVYEVKNAEWKDSWEGKLATDVANNQTKYGILVATSFNEKYNGIPFIRSEKYPNIWITDSESFVFVGQIVRKLIEVESDYLAKTQLLTQDTNNEVIKEYELKKAKLDEYWTIEFPKTYKIIETELKAIDSVKNSLENNSAKLAKASTRLNNQFKEKIIKGLSKILGTLIVEEQDENKQHYNSNYELGGQ